MKKIFCLILVFFEMMGQESLKVKYRNYRQRFNDSFILRGIEDRNCPHLKNGGYSLPADHIQSYPYKLHPITSRQINTFVYDCQNPDDCPDSFIFYNNIVKFTYMQEIPNLDFGDTPLDLGLYFGVLATEYFLYKKAGEDTKDLELEIYQAFKALERLDYKTDHIYYSINDFTGNIDNRYRYNDFPNYKVNESSCSEMIVSDGLLLRDDVKVEFFAEFFDKKIALQKYSQYSEREREILKRNFILYSGSNFRQVYNSDHNILNQPAQVIGNKNSVDHLAYLCMGLALIQKCIKYDNFQIELSPTNTINFSSITTSRDWVDRLISRVARNNWKITLSDGRVIPENQGGDAILQYSAFYSILEKYGIQNKRYFDYYDLGLNLASSIFFENINGLNLPSGECKHNIDYKPQKRILETSLNGQTYGIDIDVGREFSVGYSMINLAVSNYYSAVNSDLWKFGNNWKAYLYPMLNEVLHKLDGTVSGLKSENEIKSVFENINTDQELKGNFYSKLDIKNIGNLRTDVSNSNFSLVKTNLDLAPCDGPERRIKSHNDRGTTNWNTDQKFSKYIRSYYDGSKESINNKAKYNGLDFMLLHNLYMISQNQTLSKLGSKEFDENYQGVGFPGNVQDILESKAVLKNLNYDWFAGDKIDLLPGFDSNNAKEFDARIEFFSNINYCKAPQKHEVDCPNEDLQYTLIDGETNLIYNKGIACVLEDNNEYYFNSKKINGISPEPKWYVKPNPTNRADNNFTEIGTGYSIVFPLNSNTKSGAYTISIDYYNYEMKMNIQKNIELSINDCFIIFSGLRKENDEKLQNSNKLTIYPSPNNGLFKIEFKTETDNHFYDLSIINAMGIEILKLNQTNNINHEINISDFQKGVYILKCVEKNKITTSKFIKE